MSTWLITGCSTGLGRAFAEAALNRGHNVVATVTGDGQVIAAVATAEDRFGAVDVSGECLAPV